MAGLAETRRVALYARVSSHMQAEKDLPIQGQLAALKRYASDHGWTVAAEYLDEGLSGRNTNRPAFRGMVAAAKSKPRPFDAVLVWKFSRFARNVADAALFKSELRKRGVTVISISEPTGDGKDGRLMETMISAFDEYYSENLAEDVKRGQLESVRRGYVVGDTPFGYARVKVLVGNTHRVKFELDPARVPIVRRIFAEYLAGSSIKKIAERLNAEGVRTLTGGRLQTSTLGYILRNEAYLGHLVWNKTKTEGRTKVKTAPAEQVRVENAHPALIDAETFAKVQAKLAQKNPTVSHPRHWSSPFLLTGMAVCGRCGHAMAGSSSVSTYKNSVYKYFRYSCAGRSHGKGCSTENIKREELESAVLDQLAEVVLQPEPFLNLVAMVNEELASDGAAEEIAAIKARLDDARRRKAKLVNAIETDAVDLSTVRDRLKELTVVIADLEPAYYQAIAAHEAAKAATVTPGDVNEFLASLRFTLDSATPEERKSFLRSFVREVKVDLPEVTISYTLPMPAVSSVSIDQSGSYRSTPKKKPSPRASARRRART